MAKTKKKQEEAVVPKELEDKVLVAKPQQEQIFILKLKEMSNIANGALGWKGQAEMFYSILGKDGIKTALGLSIKCRKKENIINEIAEVLKIVFYQSLMEVAEWVTKEEADKRAKMNKVLYGSKDDSKNSE